MNIEHNNEVMKIVNELAIATEQSRKEIIDFVNKLLIISQNDFSFEKDSRSILEVLGEECNGKKFN